MATHSSTLAWKIPRTEEPGGYSPWGCKELDTTQLLNPMIDLGELLCFGPCFLSRHIPHYQCPYPYIISKSVIVLYVLPEDPFLTLSVLDLCGMGFSGPCQQTFHCIHAKSLQLYLTLFNSMDCSLPGYIHGILHPWDSPGKNTGVSCHFLLQGIFLTQESIPSLLYFLHCRQILYHLSHWGSLNTNNKSKYNYLQHGIMSPDQLVNFKSDRVLHF